MSIKSNRPEQQHANRFSAAGHRRSGVSREKARKIMWEEMFGAKSKCGSKNGKQAWGRALKVD